MNNSLDRRERTLFVSMIHKSITDDDLYELLSQAGPVEKVVFRQNEDGTLLHAVVTFRNVESVVFSMVHLSPIVQNSGLIQIRPLRKLSSSGPPEVTCVGRYSRSHSVISKFYPSQGFFLSQKLPVNCNSSAVHIGSYNILLKRPSTHLFRSHRGKCSKICCTKT
ncbi:unnamed protein product [Angiostrongylus costaricensis]|uniref:RRM domain-containing protein n=1 Tax=Angiostrongylus costaricensis TaxID=334426 RepID=A0A0R3PVL3_ANGCS|nr:unnamed protein product [Angiostrongylus costaricensis]